MFEKFSEKLLSVSEKLMKIKVLTAIRNSFATLLPLIIGGSVASLLNNVLCSTSDNAFSLAKVNGFEWLSQYSEIFSKVNYACISFMTIGVVLLIAKNLAKEYGKEEWVTSLVALASYITVCDLTASTTVEGMKEAVTISNVLPQSFTSSSNLFLGMIIAIIATAIFLKLSYLKQLKIKMPGGVPGNISHSFEVMIPGFITIISVSAFAFFVKVLTGSTLSTLISTCIQAPLTGILTGLPGYLIIFFLVSVLWSFGLHGQQILKPIFYPVLFAAITANMEAINSEKVAEFILNEPFMLCFTVVSGAGVTLGLIIAILLVSKRKDNKSVAKLSLLPGIFGINECMTFGMPIVLNPILIIPFILVPMLTSCFAYFMTSIGFCGMMIYSIPPTLPIGLNVYMASGGSLGALVTQLLCLVISVIVYIPFVFILNRSSASKKAESGEAYE